MNGVKRFREYNDRYEFPREGEEIDQCHITYSIELFFSQSNDSMSIDIEAIFNVNAGKTSAQCVPDRPETLGPALGLLRHPVDVVRAYKNGILDIVFAEGMRLTVPPSPDYEAWSLGARGFGQLICMPGGELARFRE